VTIVNVPSAEKLNDLALALYFDAWERLYRIHESFLNFYPGKASSWPNEWKKYTEASSRDFETIINLVAQSAEIAMKSKLCSVSPFLLLLGQGLSFKRVDGELDFSELRTIDSVDLPGVVNAFCPEKLTDSFIQDFNKVRRLRNKSVHLGEASESIDPRYVVDVLVNFFHHLWGEGNFFSEWVRISSRDPHFLFDDGSGGDSRSRVLDSLDIILEIITKSQFKKITGVSKSKRMYYCFRCTAKGKSDYKDYFFEDSCKTAYLLDGEDQIYCFMCKGRFDIIREKCDDCGCPGDVISSPHIKCDFHCHSCGRDRE